MSKRKRRRHFTVFHMVVVRFQASCRFLISHQKPVLKKENKETVSMDTAFTLIRIPNSQSRLAPVSSDLIHYENMPIQIILLILQQKTENFQIKKSAIFFHISAQNIDCGYSLEPPR